MPRVRKWVTDGGIPLSVLLQASDVVRDEGKSVRAVAKAFVICHTTLVRYHKQKHQERQPLAGYRTSRKVLSAEQERSLREYLTRALTCTMG